MFTVTRTVATFPSVSLPSHSGGLPVEVALIAQLGVGSGDQMIAGAAMRQREHANFIDELDEPSARIGGIDLSKGDTTSLYTFVVGPNGHPFHRHAGHRVFTAISGSAGTRLRFSTASQAQTEQDPQHFARALRHVDIPPDCLFTVRFGGGTWHQFLPLRGRASHPALFALSCHTNELGGDLPEALRQRVADNAADIPALTEVLPETLQDLLRSLEADAIDVPTVALSLHAPAPSRTARLCAVMRDLFGHLRGRWERRHAGRGFLVDNCGVRKVRALREPPADSLLREQFAAGCDHQDLFAVVVEADEHGGASAGQLMEGLLQGFLDNRPRGVSRLMAIRNVMVKPLGLRTSPLGCPVSSLLSQGSADVYAGRFPVIAHRTSPCGRHVQVVLGADDRHLQFRSCASVELLADGRAVFRLGTRVRTGNAFGRLYMALIDRVHRRYVTPTMLRMAVAHALARRLPEQGSPFALAHEGNLAYSARCFAHG